MPRIEIRDSLGAVPFWRFDSAKDASPQWWEGPWEGVGGPFVVVFGIRGKWYGVGRAGVNFLKNKRRCLTGVCTLEVARRIRDKWNRHWVRRYAKRK